MFSKFIQINIKNCCFENVCNNRRRSKSKTDAWFLNDEQKQSLRMELKSAQARRFHKCGKCFLLYRSCVPKFDLSYTVVLWKSIWSLNLFPFWGVRAQFRYCFQFDTEISHKFHFLSEEGFQHPDLILFGPYIYSEMSDSLFKDTLPVHLIQFAAKPKRGAIYTTWLGQNWSSIPTSHFPKTSITN